MREVLTPPEVNDTKRAAGASPAILSGLFLFAVALLLLILVGSLAQRFGFLRPGHGQGQGAGPLSIAITEILAILLPALVFFAGPKNSRGRRLFSRILAPTAKLPVELVGGALLGTGCFFFLSVFVEPLLEHYLPVPPEERAHVLRLLRPPEGLRPLWQDLLCFALVPALCEELLFRGALFSTLGVKLGDTSADMHGKRLRMIPLIVCGLLFGIFHLSVSKLLPTTLLGIGFGIAAMASGSLYPAIAMHFTNNALVLLLVRQGIDDAPESWRSLFGRGGIGILLSLAAIFFGLGLLGFWPPKPAREN